MSQIPLPTKYTSSREEEEPPNSRCPPLPIPWSPVENFPGAGTFIDNIRNTPLHYICFNKNITLNIVGALIDAFPASVRNKNNKGGFPLHYLCDKKNLDDEVGLDILKLLLEKCLESVRHAAEGGKLPIHLAAMNQSPEFCRLLIEAHPGSVRL